MRRTVVLMSLAAALAAAGGCERRNPAEQPTVFDPDIDAPPSYLTAQADPLLIADQTEIARRAPKPPPSAVAGTSPTDAAVEAVRQVVTAMLTAEAANDVQRIPDFFVPQDAASLKTLLTTAGELEKKSQTLADQIKQIGGEMPKEMAMLKQIQVLPGMPGEGEAATSVEDEVKKLTFAAADGKVVVSGPQMTPLTFVRSGGQWKADMGPGFRPVFTAFAEVTGGYSRFLDALSKDIKDGTITKFELPARSKDLYASNVAPAMEKFMTAVFQASVAGEQPAGAPAGPAATAAPAASGEQAARPPAATQDPTHLEQVIAMWSSGNKDKAIEEFLQIDWGKPAAFPEQSVLGMTTDKLASLPPDQNRAKSAEATAQATAIRELCDQVLKLARNASLLGDKTGAGRYLQSVVGCGQFLRASNRLSNFQMVGEVFAKASLGPQETAPPSEAAPAAVPARNAPMNESDELDINSGRGSEAGEELRQRLTAPARRVYGGGG